MNRTSVCLSCVPLTSGRALPFFYQPALVSRPSRLHPRPRYYFPLAFVVLRRLCDPLALSLSLSFVRSRFFFFAARVSYCVASQPNKLNAPLAAPLTRNKFSPVVRWKETLEKPLRSFFYSAIIRHRDSHVMSSLLS